MTRVPLCLDVPDGVRQRLLYGATELFRPLAAVPEVVSIEDLGPVGIYVGSAPEAAPAAALRIRHRLETSRALIDERPVAPEAVGWFEAAAGETVALPFPLGEARPLADASAIVEADLFASAFWWLAGVQERASRVRDRWGRFPYSTSLQSALDRPLATPVDALRAWLGATLRARGVDVRRTNWNGASWALALTHDLDAMRTRRAKAFAADAARGRVGAAFRRGAGPDARKDTAEALVALARRHEIRSTIFAKAGQSGLEDIRAEPERDGAWLRSLAVEGFEIGLHPSIQAATDGARLARERQRLAAAVGKPLTAVRSHYLRWDPAITGSIYQADGFTVDSTLGWSDATGFRRGTSVPFRLWDPLASRPSTLWEAPLAVMDTALFEHQGLSLHDAELAIADVLDAARGARGLAVILWHNAMRDARSWSSHLDILDRTIGRAQDSGAVVLTLGECIRACCPDTM